MSNENELLEKLKNVQERFSLVGPKPQDLTTEELVERIAAFLISQYRMLPLIAYGNQVGEEFEDESDQRYDPIEHLASCPDDLDQIAMYVKHDMEQNEAELLSRKDSSLYAYNTLAFGAAIKLARSETLSEDLLSFLIGHLIQPSQPKEQRGAGRPASNNQQRDIKISGIRFACLHGVTATRNDASEAKVSACDLVERAARLIFKRDKNSYFSAGFGYENLKRLWHIEKRKSE